MNQPFKSASSQFLPRVFKISALVSYFESWCKIQCSIYIRSAIMCCFGLLPYSRVSTIVSIFCIIFFKCKISTDCRPNKIVLYTDEQSKINQNYATIVVQTRKNTLQKKTQQNQTRVYYSRQRDEQLDLELFTLFGIHITKLLSHSTQLRSNDFKLFI